MLPPSCLPACRLVLRFHSDKKWLSAVLPYSFRPRRWYHLVLSHSAGSTLSLTSPQVAVYVDGQQQVGRLVPVRLAVFLPGWVWCLCVLFICRVVARTVARMGLACCWLGWVRA